MSRLGQTIGLCTTDGVKVHKILKIVPYSDGGFAVLMPYHRAREGFFGIIRVDYSKFGVQTAPALQKFTANSPVKFSYHADGFCQFSSLESGAITSGIDTNTGQPKGAGIFTSPISHPIQTGPTLGVVVWGIDEFEMTRSVKNVRVVRSEDLHFKDPPNLVNAWCFEVFVFPRRLMAAVKNVDGELRMSLAFDKHGTIGPIWNFKVIAFANQPVIFGLLSSRIHVRMDAPSGWTLSGPSQLNSDGITGRALMACYPRIGSMSQNAKSRDRV